MSENKTGPCSSDYCVRNNNKRVLYRCIDVVDCFNNKSNLRGKSLF